MNKKCLKCGAPITGFWSRISAIAGVKQSEKNPDYCNVCDDQAAPIVPEIKSEPAPAPKDLFDEAAGKNDQK